MHHIFIFLLTLILLLSSGALAKLGNRPGENERQYGDEIVSKQFSDDKRDFTGKKVYALPFFGWQLEIIYTNGRSFSETARPKGNKVKKSILTEKEANTIADFLFPRKTRGPYKKQVVNANFVSHFFENGVVSYEMQLDKKRKNHTGVIGVRTLSYNDGATFKNVMINAYH